MSENTWRDTWRPIIAAILAKCEGQSLAEKRKALRYGCPLLVREHWPYKVWLSECRIQLKLRPAFGKSRNTPAAGQKSLFE